MSANKRRPILVTGSHRSGSTWTGRMLALAPDIGYIHEPFNVKCRPGICRASFAHWFTYVSAENGVAYRDALADCLRFHYNTGAELAALRSPRDAGRMIRDWRRCRQHRRGAKRPLVKDPIALFSAEWLAETFDMDVVVIIRHPAAFAGSIKKQHATHPFADFLEQPLLMAQHLAPFKAEIEAFARAEQEIIDQANLLWNLIHHMIARYRERRPNWHFVRHEDLSADPEAAFGKLYAALGFDYTDDIRAAIRHHSAADERDPSALIKRDSRSNIWRWKKRLTDEEIGRIRAQTGAIADQFYGDEDW